MYNVPERVQTLAKAASLILGAPDEKSILAQWIAENAPDAWNAANNPGNIRAYPVSAFLDLQKEYPWFALASSVAPNGVVSFTTDLAGTAAYCLLMSAYYSQVWKAGSPAACLTALGASDWDGGHYTNPGQPVGSNLLPIYAALTDQFPSPATPAQVPQVAPLLSEPVVTTVGGSGAGAGSPVAVDETGTATPVRPYTVAPNGEWIAGIARNELGRPDRWPEIFALNPSLDPRNIIPAGTEIQLPKE